jgi:DNA-binding NtrC family response regulator
VVADFERRYLEHHLRASYGSVGATSRKAGVDPRTLYTKMRQLGLRKEDFKRR